MGLPHLGFPRFVSRRWWAWTLNEAAWHAWARGPRVLRFVRCAECFFCWEKSWESRRDPVVGSKLGNLDGPFSTADYYKNAGFAMDLWWDSQFSSDPWVLIGYGLDVVSYGWCRVASTSFKRKVLKNLDLFFQFFFPFYHGKSQFFTTFGRIFFATFSICIELPANPRKIGILISC